MQPCENVVCSANKQRKETSVIMCLSCGVAPRRTPCPGKYHMKKYDQPSTQKLNIILQRYSKILFKNWYKLLID